MVNSEETGVGIEPTFLNCQSSTLTIWLSRLFIYFRSNCLFLFCRPIGCDHMGTFYYEQNYYLTQKGIKVNYEKKI